MLRYVNLFKTLKRIFRMSQISKGEPQIQKNQRRRFRNLYYIWLQLVEAALWEMFQP